MCGVVGTFNVPHASFVVRSALHALQNRGRDGVGIGTLNGNRLVVKKFAGSVASNFTEEVCAHLPGDIAIGHTRYATAPNSADDSNIQPLHYEINGRPVAIAHNGNFTNAKDIERSVLVRTPFATHSDTERFLRLIFREYRSKSFIQAIKTALAQMKGSCSAILTRPGQLIAVRDPSGNRPLYYGKKDGGYVVASETCALDAVDVLDWKEVPPGSIISFTRNGMKSYALEPAPLRLCTFEWVYFAFPNSTIFGVSVDKLRWELGRALAREHPTSTNLIIGVPDSSIEMANGFAHVSQKRVNHGVIVRRHDTGRTFILPGQRARKKAVSEKFSFDPLRIKGKSVTVIDDSLVRGTTSRGISQAFRARGATAVHWRIASPTIVDSCRYGINTNKRRLLLAATHDLEGMRQEIDADSLQFLSLEHFKHTIEGEGVPAQDCCFACMDRQHWA
jgi:amidophosphoribosyltransferase